MIKKTEVNWEYIGIYREIFYFILIESFYKLKASRSKLDSEKILLMNNCLIGDFISSLHSIHEFIIKNNGSRVDILVSPHQKILAEKIRGVGKVFSAKSIFNRSEEEYQGDAYSFDLYKEIIAMRMSRESLALLKKIPTRKIRTGLASLVRYIPHSIKSSLIRKTPRQWREINFDILFGIKGVEPKVYSFEEIFDFKAADYVKVDQMGILDQKKKNIIIHVGSNWPMKKWSNDKWVELMSKINQTGDFNFIVVGSGEDKKDYDYITSRLNFPVRSGVGKLDLVDLMILLRKADFFIGVDSGPQNMAQLADVKSIIIFGPGPHINLPTNKKSIIFDKTNGRGVYQMYFCKEDSFIGKITVEEVFQGFKKICSLPD